MSSARALANQALYLASIVADSWRDALAREDIPATTLAGAFFPASRDHLVNAYGWFLLAIAGATSLPATPPQRCAELPTVAAGKAIPAEIRECEQLEAGGWLGEMLAAGATAQAGGRAPDNLAVSAQIPGPEQVEHWLQQLQAMFDRMGDSLDEY